MEFQRQMGYPIINVTRNYASGVARITQVNSMEHN